MIYQQILNYKCLGEEVQRRKLQTFKSWRIGAGSLVWWVDESISDAHRLAQGHSEASSYSFVLLHTIFQQDCESEPRTTTSAVTFWQLVFPPSNAVAVTSRHRKKKSTKTNKKTNCFKPWWVFSLFFSPQKTVWENLRLMDHMYNSLILYLDGTWYKLLLSSHLKLFLEYLGSSTAIQSDMGEPLESMVNLQNTFKKRDR